jgi:putative spermidine/putrescine transport system permease protein
MENIEDDLLEAAESLGANKITAFFKVIFPLSIPGLIVGSVLVFTGAFTAYTTPQLLGGNKNMVLATLVYQRAMTLGDWTGASVVATVMIITTLTVIGIINKLAGKLNERGV